MKLVEERRIKDYQFGGKLACLREMLGVSQSQLAGRLGMRESDIAAFEGGTQRLAATDLPAYAHALGFDTAILCAVIDEVERTWRDG